MFSFPPPPPLNASGLELSMMIYPSLFPFEGLFASYHGCCLCLISCAPPPPFLFHPAPTLWCGCLQHSEKDVKNGPGSLDSSFFSVPGISIHHLFSPDDIPLFSCSIEMPISSVTKSGFCEPIFGPSQVAFPRSSSRLFIAVPKSSSPHRYFSFPFFPFLLSSASPHFAAPPDGFLV